MALQKAKIDAINASIAPAFLVLKNAIILAKNMLVIFLSITLLKSLLNKQISHHALFLIKLNHYPQKSHHL